jgi:hypothetical protein
VPDAHAAAGSDPPVEILPNLQVGIGGVAREVFQIVEAAPVLDTHDFAPAHPVVHAQQALGRVLLQQRLHRRHSCRHGHPFMDSPQSIDPETDQEDNKRPFDAGGVAAGEDSRHGWLTMP